MKPMYAKHFGFRVSVDHFYCVLIFNLNFFRPQAYAYHGDSLLTDETAGEAVKCSEKCDEYMELTKSLLKGYFKLRGVGTAPKLDQNVFYGRIKIVTDRVKDKCLRENNLM